MLKSNVLGTGAVVLVLGVTGCGGSSNLSRADFVKQANAVCVKARRQIQAGRADLFTKIIAYEHVKTTGLNGLKPPSEIQADVAQYVRSQTDFAALVTQFQAATRARQSTTVLNARATTLRTQEEKLAAMLGLKACKLSG